MEHQELVNLIAECITASVEAHAQAGVQGTPEEIAENKKSFTSQFLKEELKESNVYGHE
jgi:hypothetical protein